LAGLYIHIPFCKQACFYCDFHFSVNQTLRKDVVNAICKELEIQKDYLPSSELESLYFGGGTPSLLNEDELSLIFSTIDQYFKISKSAEITLEANPDDINREKLRIWKKSGINRLSIGIQSFRNEDLKWMNRAHNSDEANHCVAMAKDEGFHSLSLDLIYGIPGLDDKSWEDNIEKALSLNPTHLSCYSLTVEQNTPLHKLISTDRYKNVDEERSSAQFDILMNKLQESNWNHYEISNFCLPGYEAVHNSNYWNQIPYLGIGPSAHSFDGHSRQWNISHNKKYLESLSDGEIPAEREVLSLKDKMNEYLLTSLRTSRGCEVNYIKSLDANAYTSIADQASEFIDSKIMIEENGFWKLSQKGKQLADKIASDLFIV
jgi:oxygen-independent coproporphyrinogen-3 oxidase